MIFLLVFILGVPLVYALSWTQANTFTPEPPRYDTNLRCQMYPSADTTKTWFRWYNGTTLFKTVKNDGNNINQIDDSLTRVGENWTCSMEITDGTNYLMENLSRVVTARGPLGFLVEPYIAPAYPEDNDNLYCYFTPINTDVNSWFRWYNGSTLKKQKKNDPDYKYKADKSLTLFGETWTCDVELANSTNSISQNVSVIIGPIPNNPPNITAIELNEYGDSGDENITLANTSTKQVSCVGYASDLDGNDKIESIAGVIYSNQSYYADVDSNSDHYTDSDCTYTSSSGYYECLVDMWYYASEGNWTCTVNVTDDRGNYTLGNDTVIVYQNQTGSQTNSPPSIDSVELNEIGDTGDNLVILDSVRTKKVACFGVISDSDGNSDIVNINTTFYHSTSSSGASDNDYTHYTNSSCDYDTGSGDYECSVDIEYYATNGTWYCNVSTEDGLGATNYSTDSAMINSGPPPDISFTSNPIITPAFPNSSESLYCNWGESSDVTSRKVYWFRNGTLYRKQSDNNQQNIMNYANTADADIWNCTVELQGGGVYFNGSDNKTVGVTQTNFEPSIDSITLDNVDDATPDNFMNINPGGLEKLNCFGSISDPEGTSDVVLVYAKIRSTSISLNNPDNPSGHYTNSSCDYNSGTGDYNCTVDVYFYALPGSWRCNVYAKDSADNVVTDYDTTTMESTISINITNGFNVDFGEMVYGEEKTDLNWKMSFANMGNVDLDLNIDAWEPGGNFNSNHSFSCSPTGYLPIENLRVANSYSSYSNYLPLVNTGYYTLDTNLLRQTSGSSIPVGYFYYGLKITDVTNSYCQGVLSVNGVPSV